MSYTQAIALAVTIVVLLYQLGVSIFVARAVEYERHQKFWQLGLIWLIPVIGATITHVFLWSHALPAKERDKNFTPQDTGGF